MLQISTAAALEIEEYRVRAQIAEDFRHIEGVMQIALRVSGNEDGVRLWLYPDRLRDVPAAMDQRSARWVFPGEADFGGITVQDLRVDGVPVAVSLHSESRGEPRGRDVAGSDVHIPLPDGSSGDVRVSLRFRLTLPDRFGRLGKAHGQLSLAAPWYPLVVDADDAFAWDARHDVRLTHPAGRAVLAVHTQAPRAYAPALAADRFFSSTSRVEGVALRFRASHAFYQAPPPEERSIDGLQDLAHVEVTRHMREAVGDALLTARELGLPLPEVIDFWEIPSRSELVATAPGVVLFSDRLFQVFPINQTLDFHRRSLRRAVFRHLITEATRAWEAPVDRGWAADMRAVAWVDLDEARRRHGAQTPQELLNVFAFHPAVDQLLYAPQIAFEDTYFATVEERDPFRDDPVRARRPLSRGRRLLESARDAMSEETFRGFVNALVSRPASVREVLREVDVGVAADLEGWLAATGAGLNYRLGQIRSRQRSDGRYVHAIHVHQDGAQRREWLEVEVVDIEGQRDVVRWRTGTAEIVVEAVTEAPLADVRLDPRYRLPQDPAVADGHPRADDATDLPWRPPILNGFLLNVFVSEEDFTGLVDFSVRRRYDLEHSFGFRLERTAALTGGQVRYAQGIGPKVHANRRLASIGGGVGFDRLHAFFGDGDLGGWRTQLFAAASLNTVAYTLDPREGFWASVRVTGAGAWRDDGTFGWTLRGGFRAGVVLPLSLLQSIVFVAGGGFTAGDALRSELQGLGGGARLRGFESGELLGRGSVYGVAEYRWTALRDLAMNVFHLVWVREIQFAAFTGTGFAFETLQGEESVWAADVGGGIRIHYDYGGVQPGLISLDIGVPLTRASQDVIVDGEVVRQRNPIGFYVGFDQYF